MSEPLVPPLAPALASESRQLESPEATERAGSDLAQAITACAPDFLCVYLQGELGAGKTTLARGVLRGFGHEGRVPSPTYTLVEPYDCAGYRIFHLDLYRLQQSAELEFLGIDAMTNPGSLLFVEWPSRAADTLPPNDLEIILKVNSNGRQLDITAAGEVGVGIINRLQS